MSRDDTRRPFDRPRPVTRKQALAAGISLRELRTSAFRRLHTGIYIDATVEMTPVLHAEAALLPFGPKAFASHASAARVLGLPIPTLPNEHVTVVDKRERRSRPGIDCHYSPSGRVIEVDGVRISSGEQVFVELATLLPLVDLVVVGDHLVRSGRVGADELRKFCAASDHRGAARAQDAVAYVRDRVDSPMETRLRMLIVLAGLPEPRINPLVGDGVDVPRRKYDLCWPEVKVVVEYDGRHHVERVEQWEADLRRRESVDDDGWRILVMVSGDIYRTPGDTVTRIHRVLRDRRLAGVPARPSQAWRPHFPGHR